MVRLADLPEHLAEAYRALPLPEFDATPWVQPPPLEEARVAIISTAGLHRRDDVRFGSGATDYRVLPGDVDVADIAMSHVSLNFDRSGFQQDVNVVFPIERLRDLAAEGAIGGVADWHYSFMGSTDPSRMEDAGTHVGRLLKQDGVGAVVLVPV